MNGPPRPPSPASSAWAALDLDGSSWLGPTLTLGALLAATGFATLRAAMAITVGHRLLQREPSDERRNVLAVHLGRLDTYATSATLLTVLSQVLFLALFLETLGAAGGLEPPRFLLALGLAVVAMVLAGEVLPPALARAGGDRLVALTLPTFGWLQTPLAPVRRAVEGLRRAVLRVLQVPDEEPATRRLLAGLRGALREAEPARDLDDQERELIENVLEFRGADAVEVMTPRTEMHAVAIEDGLEAALQTALEHGCSRIPVYEDTVDTVIGTVTVLDAARARGEGAAGEAGLRALLRPPFLVPETKLLAELLKELRQRREKMAIVVDEYGGTAGLVTLTDVLRELVGEIPEVDAAAETVRPLEGGAWEVPASLHVTEVNEELGLDLPEEEDFETVAGFVLARLGRFPRAGESFEEGPLAFEVLEASDRRVLRVRVDRPA